MTDYLSGWLESENAEQDKISVKRAYIDINEGNLYDGVLFSQIMYWHGRNLETGKPRLTICKDGFLWLAKRYEDWQDECRIDAATARKCIDRMVKRGLLVKKVYHFGGVPMVHIRIDRERVSEALKAICPVVTDKLEADVKPIRPVVADKVKTKPSLKRPVVADGSDTSGHMDMLRGSSCYTETTPETTPEIPKEIPAGAGFDIEPLKEVSFDDIPTYEESKAIHGAVYNRQHAFKEKIVEVWGWPIDSTQNTHREQQLRGVATKGEWKECNLPPEYAERLEPDDLPYWKTWELSRGVQSADKILVSRAAPVQASIMAYIDAGKPRAVVKSTNGNGTHAAANQPRHARAPRQMTPEEIAAEDAKWAAMNAPEGGAA